MLRAKTKQTIFNLLEDSYFGASNFDVEYGDGVKLWIKITFIPSRNFVFMVTRGSLRDDDSFVSGSPGVRLLSPDYHSESTFEAAIKNIPDWIGRVKEEVVDSNPINREVQAIRKQLEERIDLMASRQEEYFTRAEAAFLTERLNEFLEKLREISSTNGDLEEVVNELKARIDELARASQVINKGTWLRMAGSRLLSTTKAVIGSKEGRELAVEVAKKILLEGPK